MRQSSSNTRTSKRATSNRSTDKTENCSKCKRMYVEIPESGIYAKDKKCGPCQDLEALVKSNTASHHAKKRDMRKKVKK